MSKEKSDVSWIDDGHTIANRTVKDTLFRYIFSQPENLLKLYNAVSGSNYEDTEDLEITTLDNIIYMTMKNDVSFIISQEMDLFEHQSSFNPNMPLRGVFYFAELYKKYVASRQLDIYRSSQLTLPFPRYLIFYNGRKELPERMELRLSDSFARKDLAEPPALECTATVLNINYGHNHELMESCRMLAEYAVFVQKIRDYQVQGYVYTVAVDRALDDCIASDILRDILSRHREEVRNMILTEYDPEFHIRKEKELSYQEGIEQGMAQGIVQGYVRSCAACMAETHCTPEEAAAKMYVPDEFRDMVLQELEKSACHSKGESRGRI